MSAPKWLPGFAYQLSTQAPERVQLEFYEVYPPLGLEVNYTPLTGFYSSTPFSLELWREDEDSPIRIVYGVPNRGALKPLEQAYPGALIRPLEGPAEPGFIRQLPETPVFFSAELAHALPFTFFEPDYGAFLNRLAAAMTGPCWVQAVWALRDWAFMAEEAAMRLSAWIQSVEEGSIAVAPDVSALSSAMLGHTRLPQIRVEREESPQKASTVYQIGRKIAQEYFAKAQSTPILLHIRGLLVPGYAYPSFDAAFSSVRVHWDMLVDVPVRDPRALRWMRARALPDVSEQLKWHAEGGFLCEWGKGRELVAGLCVTPEELPVFIGLPTDPSLPVKWTRKPAIPRAASALEEEEGLSLWC